jgi:5-methylcytosine-specific restriction endonuclease McrA
MVCAWQRFYTTAFWQRRRKLQLIEHPLCKFCLASGKVTAATIADHVEPHRGDRTKFMTGALQSLCQPCHKGRKAQVETQGYADDIGVDGAPIDPRHPWNLLRSPP